MNQDLFLALISTILFSVASISYGIFSERISTLWMNSFKALVALFAFAVAGLFTGELFSLPNFQSFIFLFLGGFIGLNVGDYYLLKATERIGASRMLIIFSFQPIFVASFAFFFLGQGLSMQQIFAIACMISCVLVVSYEKFKSDGRWEILGPLFAFIGVLLDCLSVIITRYAFDVDPQLDVIEANFYRCLGAGMGFWIFFQFYPVKFVRRLKRMKLKPRLSVFAASFFGTFVALWLYLAAIEDGHLGNITAVVGSGPLFTAIFESIWFRRLPSPYLVISLSLFIIGFSLLI